MNNFNKEKNIKVDATIYDDKLVLRVHRPLLDSISVSDPLNKKRLFKLYDGLYDIFELSNEILNKFNQ